ncbi:hypothetical protein M231_03955 [Tremella mesenterica]|uniref:Uncharacterized protein n=1 Tax=Tremella mesenterica TaxID=5217 RepID=A0A4Q1BLV1_TREME|nr:uncharacterized protein TREMEDRAFT_64808 [Tremella mesenterica DSM 1558]EIW66949.1 hypothetical protein TREMEDRAFT_64808 [Tremella mesenterica DSM 1558]RXK38779.1 hypothetical protein M231_03955 [Tremella mesenterica]
MSEKVEPNQSDWSIAPSLERYRRLTQVPCTQLQERVLSIPKKPGLPVINAMIDQYQTASLNWLSLEAGKVKGLSGLFAASCLAIHLPVWWRAWLHSTTADDPLSTVSAISAMIRGQGYGNTTRLGRDANIQIVNTDVHSTLAKYLPHDEWGDVSNLINKCLVPIREHLVSMEATLSVAQQLSGKKEEHSTMPTEAEPSNEARLVSICQMVAGHGFDEIRQKNGNALMSFTKELNILQALIDAPMVSSGPFRSVLDSVNSVHHAVSGHLHPLPGDIHMRPKKPWSDLIGSEVRDYLSQGNVKQALDFCLSGPQVIRTRDALNILYAAQYFAAVEKKAATSLGVNEGRMSSGTIYLGPTRTLAYFSHHCQRDGETLEGLLHGLYQTILSNPTTDPLRSLPGLESRLDKLVLDVGTTVYNPSATSIKEEVDMGLQSIGL